MTRIIAGAAGGTRIDVPKSGTRPTSDRVREAVFSTLEAWDMLADSSVLDLFAGSGALGFESASRGATTVTLVEKHAPAAQVVSRNANLLRSRLGQRCSLTVHRQSALSYLEGAVTTDAWDVVFIDPPYDYADGSLERVLELVLPRLREGAVVMLERSTRAGMPPWPAGFSVIREKKYGETTVWWAEAE